MTRATSAMVAVLTLSACAENATEPRQAAVSPLPEAGSATLVWQEQTRSLVAANPVSPMAAGRLFAAVSVAQRRAIQDLEGENGGRAQLEANRGAIASASSRVLGFFFPGAASMLEQKVVEQGEASPGDVHPHFTRGVAIGQQAGAAMIQRLQNDGFTAQWTGTVPTGPGLFVPLASPPAAIMLGTTKPYFLTAGSQFRAAPPPAFGSAEFLTDLDEVLTRAQNKTPEEMALILFWDALPRPNPIGRWNITTATYVAENNLDDLEATRVFALTHAAIFDAMIGCWDSKYHYWYIRPSQANPAIPLPIGLPNHPSYPSGHSCVSAAAGRVLAQFFPSHTTELNNMVADAGLSRILAGIHYRFDVTAGQVLGRSVANWVIARNDF
jgi:membrane-associated phospholipid phosphatase